MLRHFLAFLVSIIISLFGIILGSWLNVTLESVLISGFGLIPMMWVYAYPILFILGVLIGIIGQVLYLRSRQEGQFIKKAGWILLASTLVSTFLFKIVGSF